jgi:hypothetical protein
MPFCPFANRQGFAPFLVDHHAATNGESFARHY